MFLTLLEFTNRDDETYAFISNPDNRVQRFSPSGQIRSEERPRMEAHGRWPTFPYADALSIQHDGMVVGGDDAAAAIERDIMMGVILGNLALVPDSAKMGTMKLQKASMTETASAPVTLESWSADIGVETIRHLPYSFQWIVYQGFFIGDDTNTYYTI